MKTMSAEAQEAKDYARILRQAIREATGGHTGESITVETYEQRKAWFEKYRPGEPYSEPRFMRDCVRATLRRTVDGLEYKIDRLVSMREVRSLNVSQREQASFIARSMAEAIDRTINTLKENTP